MLNRNRNFKLGIAIDEKRLGSPVAQGG